MQNPDRLNQVMYGAIHLLDDFLKSRPRVPEQVVELVHQTLTGTAQVVGHVLDRGLEKVTSSRENIG